MLCPSPFKFERDRSAPRSAGEPPYAMALTTAETSTRCNGGGFIVAVGKVVHQVISGRSSGSPVGQTLISFVSSFPCPWSGEQYAKLQFKSWQYRCAT